MWKCCITNVGTQIQKNGHQSVSDGPSRIWDGIKPKPDANWKVNAKGEDQPKMHSPKSSGKVPLGDHRRWSLWRETQMELNYSSRNQFGGLKARISSGGQDPEYQNQQQKPMPDCDSQKRDQNQSTIVNCQTRRLWICWQSNQERRSEKKDLITVFLYKNGI